MQQEKANFFNEIRIVKMISREENCNELSIFVVNMLGYIITREPMMLILEFMEYGNLLNYFKAIRAKVIGEGCDIGEGWDVPLGLLTRSNVVTPLSLLKFWPGPHNMQNFTLTHLHIYFSTQKWSFFFSVAG